MPDIVGIRFKSCGKIYDFDANSLSLKAGDRVVVESDFGLSIAVVAEPPHQTEEQRKDLKRVLRTLTDEDIRQKKENEKFEQEAKCFCYERVMARGLPMQLVCAESTLDRKKVVFYFTADGRIDFRELVKDLAAKFKTRIEMRQIGVRDKAKLVGGFGICGRELCCREFLTSFEPISIKMAKQQDLTLNTGKLSGSCGRLMCCLGYEYGEPSQSAAETGKAPVSEKKDEVRKTAGPADESPVEEEEISEEAGEEETADEAAEPAAAQAEGTEGEKKPHRRRRRRRFRRKPKKDE
jgi:cell fate regulator YaaT (PSP1 superfamily)